MLADSSFIEVLSLDLKQLQITALSFAFLSCICEMEITVRPPWISPGGNELRQGLWQCLAQALFQAHPQ